MSTKVTADFIINCKKPPDVFAPDGFLQKTQGLNYQT